MLNSRRKLVTDSFFYVVLGFLPLATNFLLAPIYSIYISPEEYGIISLSLIFQGFLVLFITLGLDAGFSRIYFEYHKKEKLVDALMSTTLLAILIGGVLIWIILFLAGDSILGVLLQNKAFTFQKYGNFVFFIAISTAIHTVFLSYYRNKEKVFQYSIVSLSFFFTSVAGILIGVVYLEAEAIGNIVGRAAGAVLVVSILLLIYFSRKRIRFKLKYLNESLKFSLPLVPYLLLLVAYNSIDKLMIEQYFSLEILGLYNFAFQLASVVSVLMYAVFNAVSPRIYRLLTGGSKNEISEARRINTAFHLLIIGIITFAVAVIVPILETLIDDKYQSVRDYISVLILVYVFQVYYVVYSIPLFFNKRTKALPWISGIVLITGLVSNIIFIPLFGIYGVCLALVLTKGSQVIAAYLFIRYYGYDKEEYLSLKKNHIVTFSILIIFGTVFTWNLFHKEISLYLLNIIPLLVFVVCGVVFYRNEWGLIKKLVRVLKS